VDGGLVVTVFDVSNSTVSMLLHRFRHRREILLGQTFTCTTRQMNGLHGYTSAEMIWKMPGDFRGSAGAKRRERRVVINGIEAVVQRLQMRSTGGCQW
jgi:hypothetical protein